MTKKDYEAAARIAQETPEYDDARHYVVKAFTDLFTADNPAFDADRFTAACQPGANVRARGKR